MRRLALLALVIAGCTTTESSDVLTSGIYAQIAAQATGDGKTDVSATLFVGNPIGLNFVELTGDDSLSARSGGQVMDMRETQLLNTVAHHAVFPTDAEGTAFEVTFDRAVDDGAPSSVATLPAKFAIATAPQAASRAQALTVTWAPAGSADSMSWSASGDCIETEGAPIDGDPGTVTIAGATLKKRMGDQIADQCAITVTISRSKPGMLDLHYGKGGIVSGIQARASTITSMP